MYAIIETGGKQYKVNEGDVIYVEKLDVNEGETVTFDLDELNADYFELASISEQIAKASGLID